MLSSSLLAKDVPPEGYELFASEARLLVSTAAGRRRSDQSLTAGLYWSLGQLAASHQLRHGWKGGVLRFLSEDLRAWFPGMTGLSCRNLQYMRAFATAWPERPAAGVGIAALPWGQITVLLDKVPDAVRREELIADALRHGWSRARLQERALAGNTLVQATRRKFTAGAEKT